LIEKKRVMEGIQQRIDNFNNALNTFNQNSQAVHSQPMLSRDGAGGAASTLIQLPDLDDMDDDEDMLPDPSSLGGMMMSYSN
jgi:hypothetical protein